MNGQILFPEIQKLEEKIRQSQLPETLVEKLKNQIERVNLSLRYQGGFGQFDILTNYVDWVTSLPWNSQTEDILDIKRAREIMDKNHFGLETVKKRILEYLSLLILQKQRLQRKTFHAPILLFVGLAGTGKTTFARSIAEALGRKFARIPFGGLSSSTELRGIPKNQPGAEPGQIIKALRRVQSKNPVILLDELDRVAPEAKGSVMGVLLELLDPQQNSQFIDHYIDYPFDLSGVLFVATANNTTNIATAVMDRLEVIQMPSYTDQEKIIIAKNYLLPRLLGEIGLPKEVLKVEEVVFQKIARLSGYDPGIRSVERYVEQIVRKVAYKFVNGEGNCFVINEINMKEYLN